MPTLTLPVSAYLVGGAKSSQKYGMVTPLKVQQGAWDVMVSASVAKIPRGAVVTSAVLNIWGAGTFTGTVGLSLYANTGAWTSSVTWATLPTRTAAVATVSKTSPVPGAMWTFDVTTTAQGWVSGTSQNYGLILASNSATLVRMRGTKAADAPPVLMVTYSMVPAAPTNLSPSSGMVADALPTLTWDADDAITQAQVQIAPPPGTGTPDFDSGAFATVAGLLDLSTTSYAGLGDGAVKVWRVRQRNDQGWSTWSTWATIARSSKPVLTLLAPGATVFDGTPPVQWSLASGQQVAWRAQLVDATGKVLADSGKTAGAASDWTPPTGLTRDGQSGTVRVWVWDDVDRAAGPGAPVSIYVEQAVTLQLDATVPPVDTLNATQAPPSPVVILTGTRAAGIPDKVQVFRDGMRIAEYDGVDVFYGGGFRIEDATATMSTSTTYRVAPVVNGKVAKGGPTSSITPTCVGIWLFDADDITQAVMISGGDAQDQASPETSIEHVPISTDGPVQVVRRRMVRLPAQGSISGLLVDALDVEALDSETALRAFADNDAGHLYRLVLGRANYLVIVGNIDLDEQPIDNASQRVVGVALDWWSRA